jgi:hypothetical protein
LAWLLAQGDDIAPIPGTKRVSRVEENTAADAIDLSVEQIARLNDLTPATATGFRTRQQMMLLPVDPLSDRRARHLLCFPACPRLFRSWSSTIATRLSSGLCVPF